LHSKPKVSSDLKKWGGRERKGKERRGKERKGNMF